MNNMVRLPHAALNCAGLRQKAEKIFRLVNLYVPKDRSIQILEVGTGSGVIARYLAQEYGERAQVHAVDVVDQRVVTNGFRFQLVERARLPFEDDTFDSVFTKHVVEHVGGREDQILHLRLAASLPGSWLQVLRAFSPTHICLFAKRDDVLGSG